MQWVFSGMVYENCTVFDTNHVHGVQAQILLHIELNGNLLPILSYCCRRLVIVAIIRIIVFGLCGTHHITMAW